MTNIIDGLNFDLPLVESQVIALAKLHKKQLDDAVFHQEIHLGKYNLLQRERISDFTKDLNADEKAQFYQYYNDELKRIAADDHLHPPHSEGGVSTFTIFLVLAVIALILYFAIIRRMIT